MTPLGMTYRAARRVVVFVVGTTVVLFGIVLIVTPGPAVVVIPIGLAILGIEFAWARNLLGHFKARAGALFRRGVTPPDPDPEPAPREPDAEPAADARADAPGSDHAA